MCNLFITDKSIYFKETTQHWETSYQMGPWLGLETRDAMLLILVKEEGTTLSPNKGGWRRYLITNQDKRFVSKQSLTTINYSFLSKGLGGGAAHRLLGDWRGEALAKGSNGSSANQGWEEVGLLTPVTLPAPPTPPLQ